MHTQSIESIKAILDRIIAYRRKITVVFNHTKTRQVKLHLCLIRMSEDGFINASNSGGEIRFWISDIDQIARGQINLSFLS